MTTPRQLELRTLNGEPRLTAAPVAGIESLYTGDAVVLDGTEIPEGTNTLDDPAAGTALDISLALDPGSATDSGIVVHAADGQGTVVGYDAEAGEVYLDRTNSGATDFSAAFPSVERAEVTPDADGLVRLRVLVDASSVEVFAADGATTITDAVYPEETATGVSLFADGGAATAVQLRINQLSDYRNTSITPEPSPSASPSAEPTTAPSSAPSTAPSTGPSTPGATPTAAATTPSGSNGPLAHTGAAAPLLLVVAAAMVLAGVTLRGSRLRR